MSGAETSSVLLREPLVVGTIHSPACLRAAIRIRPGQIDLFELRVDHFAKTPELLEESAPLLPLPRIVTVRHPSEGGQNQLSAKQRRALYARFMPLASYIDVELRSLETLAETLELARARGMRIIGSAHFFRSTPPMHQLRLALRRAAGARVDLCKVAARADRVPALQRLLALFETPPRGPLSVMAMGKFGKISRLLFAQAGSVLNYGYLSKPNASGQWSAIELREHLRELET